VTSFEQSNNPTQNKISNSILNKQGDSNSTEESFLNFIPAHESKTLKLNLAPSEIPDYSIYLVSNTGFEIKMFSTSKDYDNILLSGHIQFDDSLAKSLLLLNPRNWIKELFEIHNAK